MKQDRPPELDMTLDGAFVTPPRPPVISRLMMWAVVVAVIAGALSLAAFALWLALLILPVAFAAGLAAWAIYRFQVWRAEKSLSTRRHVWRPGA